MIKTTQKLSVFALAATVLVAILAIAFGLGYLVGKLLL
jgi:hypothetical protein